MVASGFPLVSGNKNANKPAISPKTPNTDPGSQGSFLAKWRFPEYDLLKQRCLAYIYSKDPRDARLTINGAIIQPILEKLEHTAKPLDLSSVGKTSPV